MELAEPFFAGCKIVFDERIAPGWVIFNGADGTWAAWYERTKTQVWGQGERIDGIWRDGQPVNGTIGPPPTD
jgi:hypothetical protein